MSTKYQITNPDEQPVYHGTTEVNNILQELNATSKDILLSMVITLDGLTITSSGTTFDEAKTGAMCSELLTVCKKSAKELEQGNINEMLLRCTDSNILLMPSGTMLFLALMTKPEINLGLLLIEVKRAAKAISACL